MKIPYGNADFAEIREKGAFYVDKTPFLPELENDELGFKNLCFLRPRRFGKSLLVSMMEQTYLADQHLVPMVSRGLEVKAGTLVFIGCKDVEFRAFVKP